MSKKEIIEGIKNKASELSALLKQAETHGLKVEVNSTKHYVEANGSYFELLIKEESVLFSAEI